MLNVVGLKISISRGDTGSITVTFTGQDAPEDGTIALVGLKKTIDSENTIWEKRLTVGSSAVTIPLMAEDTDYSYGKYFWCLRLLYGNGDVYTPMDRPEEFNILPVIGDASGGDSDG